MLLKIHFNDLQFGREDPCWGLNQNFTKCAIQEKIIWKEVPQSPDITQCFCRACEKIKIKNYNKNLNNTLY